GPGPGGPRDGVRGAGGGQRAGGRGREPGGRGAVPVRGAGGRAGVRGGGDGGRGGVAALQRKGQKAKRKKVISSPFLRFAFCLLRFLREGDVAHPERDLDGGGLVPHHGHRRRGADPGPLREDQLHLGRLPHPVVAHVGAVDGRLRDRLAGGV